ncbi:MAG: hypothetical protein KAH54_08865 [Candidatus Sabulitectum sp.]|nr:hypothetical protein [Candidatus Sabulitectum sp.]
MDLRTILAWSGLLVMVFGGRLMTTDVAAQYQVAESVYGVRDLFTSNDGWHVSGVRSDNYVPHAPGYSIILLPSAGIGVLLGLAAGKVAAALTSAFASVLLVLAVKKLAEGFMGRIDLVRFLLVMTGTMALMYGRMPYDVTSAAALALWGAWLMQTDRAFIAGILLGAALLVRPDSIVLLPMYWTEKRNLEKLALAAAGAFPFVLGILGYNFYRFGAILSDGHAQDPAIAVDMFSRGIPGLLFSPGKGLFWYAPLTILAIFHCGDWRFWSPFAFSLVLHGFFHDWTGGTGWGPRFLFMVLPVLFMPLMRPGTGGKIFKILAVTSLLITLAAGITDSNALEQRLGADDIDSQSRQTVVWSPGGSPLLHTLLHPDITHPDLLGYHVAGIPGAALQFLAGAALLLYALRGKRWKRA